MPQNPCPKIRPGPRIACQDLRSSFVRLDLCILPAPIDLSKCSISFRTDGREAGRLSRAAQSCAPNHGCTLQCTDHGRGYWAGGLRDMCCAVQLVSSSPTQPRNSVGASSPQRKRGDAAAGLPSWLSACMYSAEEDAALLRRQYLLCFEGIESFALRRL